MNTIKIWPCSVGLILTIDLHFGHVLFSQYKRVIPLEYQDSVLRLPIQNTLDICN